MRRADTSIPIDGTPVNGDEISDLYSELKVGNGITVVQI